MGPMVILVIVVTAVLTAALGAGWGQFLDHRRRVAAMEVIKAAIVAGREPPRQVLDELAGVGTGPGGATRWSAVVAFTALSAGFWTARAVVADPGPQTAFLVVATTMSVTAIGLLILALVSGGARHRDGQ